MHNISGTFVVVKTITRTCCFKLGSSKPASATLAAYGKALRLVSEYAFEHTLWNCLKLHHELYQTVRSTFGLKSQMACSVFRQVSATYHDKEHRQSVHLFDSRSMALQAKRDWCFKSPTCVSINTMEGRQLFDLTYSDFRASYLDGTWDAGGATLVDKQGILYLHVSFSKEVEEPVAPAADIIGVDLGQNNLAVMTNKANGTQFVGGGSVKNRHRQMRRVIKALKSKGTSSARRRLRAFAGKQKRFQRAVNHVVSKQIVAFAAQSGAPIIALEDLTGIRKATRRGARARSEFHNWGFFQLRSFTEYKAAFVGMGVILVDPAYTSQGCSACGHTERNNRKGAAFKCLACGCELHADLNAARNIADRARLSRQCFDRQGPVNDPSMLRPLIRDDTGEASEQAPPFGAE